MNEMHFCSQSAPAGWQTAVWFAAPGVHLGDDPSSVNYPIGPVFRTATELWAWQADNLPKLNQG